MKHPREQIANNIAEVLETLIVKGTGMFPGVKPNAAEIVDRVNTLTYYQLRLREPLDFFDQPLDVLHVAVAAGEDQGRRQALVVADGGFGRGGVAAGRRR